MTTNTQYIVQKLWNYCNILRDDGMSYGDYVEQLTYLQVQNGSARYAAPWLPRAIVFATIVAQTYLFQDQPGSMEGHRHLLLSNNSNGKLRLMRKRRSKFRPMRNSKPPTLLLNCWARWACSSSCVAFDRDTCHAARTAGAAAA